MLEGMVTEKELLKLMDLKLSELSFLRREKGLPYVRLSNTRRVYLEEDLLDWFRAHRYQSSTGVDRGSQGIAGRKQALPSDDKSDDTDVERGQV